MAIRRLQNSLNPLLLIFLLVRPCQAVRPLPEDMHAAVAASIENVYNEKFKQAEEEARRIIKKYPEHPAGYFCFAAAIEAWMRFYQSDKREEDFYRCCDKAIETAERLLDKDPSDAWVKFFYGGADGYKGAYESRYERWITSFRHGWKGVSALLEIGKSDPEIRDVNYGIGMYNYWRSAMTKRLRWLPGVGDNTELGIKQMFDAKNFGLFTRSSAAEQLIPVLNNENRFGDALVICDEMLERYPTTLTFYWGRGAALFGLERYEEARKIYEYILSRVEAEAIDNHYNAVLCHYWLAKIFLQQKLYTQSLAECNRMQNYKLDDEIRKRLDKFFREAAGFKTQAQQAGMSKREGEFKPE
jgi:tetratricopeptide (TPR) repeat protein